MNFEKSTSQGMARSQARADMMAAQASGERNTSPYWRMAYGYQPGDLVGDEVVVNLPDRSGPGAPPVQTGQG